MAAIQSVAAKLHFTDEFKEKQAHLFQIFASLIQDAGSKQWKTVSTPEKYAFNINSTGDFRLFL